MKKILLVMFSVLFLISSANAAELGFSWLQNPPEQGVDGYKLYWGVETGTYSTYIDVIEKKLCKVDTGDCVDIDESVFVGGPETSEDGSTTTGRYTCRVFNQFEPGGTYYFVVTAYNELGESDNSIELSYTFPWEPSEVPSIPELFQLIINNVNN